MGSAYLAGIDGGQTATKLLLARTDGTVLAAVTGPFIEHFTAPGGLAWNRSAIQSTLRSALDALPDDIAALAAVGAGLTGIRGSAEEVARVRTILGEVVAINRLTVVPDYVTNHLGACGGEPGVIVIAGGGSIAYGRDRRGREAIAGGFGYLLGDEGSAYDIGRRALIAAARASDGRDPPTALEGVLIEALQIAEIRELKTLAYRPEFTRQHIAALAPFVSRTAKQGDPVARQIMADAGRELAHATLAVARRLRPRGEAVAIYPTGGVFAAGDVLLATFTHTISEAWPAGEVRWPRHPPVVGALIAAARLQGTRISRAWLERVEKSRNRVLTDTG